MRPPRDTQVEHAFAREAEARVGAKSSDVSQEQPAETNSLPKRLPSESAEAASEARSEAKPSGVNKEDSSSRASRGDEARSEAKSSGPSEVNKEKTRTSIHKKSTTTAHRTACLLVPALALAAELRAEPELRGRPLAIATAPGPRGEVLACSPEAERAGVRTGSGVVHARATCAALVVRVLSPAKERAAREALRDAALGCAPRAELAPPATGFYAAEVAVFIDARGIGALYQSEAGFAAALAARAERLGLPAVVAIADARGTALIAARLLAHGAGASEATPRSASTARTTSQPNAPWCRSAEAASEARSSAESSTPSEVNKERSAQLDVRNTQKRERPPGTEPPSYTRAHVVAKGDDAAFLAPLALDLLNPDDALADALSRFGLRRVGDLLRTPERALLNRLGPGLLPLLALARGEDREPPPRAPEHASFEEGTELEAPVARLEPLLFVLRGLLARLAERLACRGLAFGELTLDLTLEGRGRDVRTLGLAAPTLDVRSVLRLAALALEAAPPRAAIDAVSVTTAGAALHGDQLDFFAPAGPAPAALSRTLAELAALCGPERVGAPALADAHRPDAFAMAPFVVLQRRGTNGASTAVGLAVRALRPALAASVRSARGSPHWVQSALANGEVLSCAGPWRTTGQWWSEERYAFDHFDVQTSDGSIFRLRRDLLRELWEIDAVFD